MKQETRMHVWYFAIEKRTTYEVINDFRRHDSTLRVDNVANGYKMEWIGSVQSEMLNVEVQSETQQREGEMGDGKAKKQGSKGGEEEKERGRGEEMRLPEGPSNETEKPKQKQSGSQSEQGLSTAECWLPDCMTAICCSAPQPQMLIHSQHTAACKWAGQKQDTPAFNLAKAIPWNQLKRVTTSSRKLKADLSKNQLRKSWIIGSEENIPKKYVFGKRWNAATHFYASTIRFEWWRCESKWADKS